MSESAYIYILTNRSGTLYIGSTENLKRRVKEHIAKKNSGFTAKYNINKLIYYSKVESIKEAIIIEKRVKGWTRKKKLELIKTINPEFKNLLEELK